MRPRLRLSLTSCSTRVSRKGIATIASHLPPLPQEEDWRSVIPAPNLTLRTRISTRNPNTAALLADSFINHESVAVNGPKTIIEAFPGMLVHPPLNCSCIRCSGPGALSRALLSLPRSKVGKLIILEEEESFLKHLYVSYPSMNVSPILNIRLASCRSG